MNTFASALLFLIAIPTTAGAAFYDVPEDHAHREAIDYVQSHGIVEGYDNGKYQPEAIINRAEFTKIVIAALYDNISGERCFPDVQLEWFAKYVCRAKDLDVIGGYPDGAFRPGQPVSFVEAAKIIVRAFGRGTAGSGGAWYEPFVKSLAGDNAIPIQIASLNHRLSRGEMAEIIYRLHAGRVDKDSRTYEQVAGLTGPRIATEPQLFAQYPYTIPIGTTWEDDWNFYVVEDPVPMEPEKGFDLLTGLDLSRVERVEEYDGRFPSFLRVHFPKGSGTAFNSHFYHIPWGA